MSVLDRGKEQAEFFWKHACPVFVDAVGYATSIESDTRSTRKQLADHFKNLQALIAGNKGRLIDTAGDGVFAEFRTVKEALICLSEFLSNVDGKNQNLPIRQKMRFRCGVASGQVLQEEHLISGVTVNIAARLQQLAEPGTINVDGHAHREVRGDNQFTFVDQGFRLLKGIRDPVRVWRVADEHHDNLLASARMAQVYANDRRSAANDRTPGLDETCTAAERTEATLNRRSSDWTASARGIAVLPFEMPPQDIEGTDGEERYIALGLASDIAESLFHSRWLKVISPRSSLNYSDARYQDNEIARELGVRYLLKGRMTRLGDTYKISVQLIDCPTGALVWSQTYQKEAQTLLSTLDQIASHIAATIEPEYLRQESLRAAADQPRNLTTWDLLMRGRWHFWRGSRKNIEQAISCAEKALQLEPNNSSAMSLLAFCHMTLVWTAREKNFEYSINQAVKLARNAVSADDRDAYAHFTLGSALSLSGDLKRAIAAQRRSLELSPTFASARGELARLLVFAGQIEEGRAAALQAIELSPSDPHISLFVRTLAFASFIEGNMDEAVELAQEAIAKRPDWFFHHITLASFEGSRGNDDAARLALAESRRLVPKYPLGELRAGHPFGDQAVFEKFLDGLRRSGWTETG